MCRELGEAEDAGGVRMKVRECVKASGEDSFGEVASPSAGKNKQRQTGMR